MIEVKRISLSNLHKIETILLLTEVVKIVEKYNPVALRLDGTYDLLVLQMDKAEILSESYGAHSLTPKLDKLHKKRLNYAALINSQLLSLNRVDSEEIKYQVKDAQKISTLFLINLGQKRLDVVRIQIDMFFSQLRRELNIVSRDAFIGLGLQHYLDDLQKTNILYKKLYNQRDRDIEKRPITSDHVLERETQKMMRLFFEQVNSYQGVFKEIDYSPLINDLNMTLTEYSKILKTRVATNKRRARKKALAAKNAAAAKEIKLTTLTDENAEDKTKVIPMKGSSTDAKAKSATKNKGKGKTKRGK